MAAPHCIYTDEMTGLMHGESPRSPLWEPNCRPHEVAIGDVGYIRQGRFCRLFNATVPPGDPRNEFGTPDGFEPLILDERAVILRRLLPGPLVSRSIVNSGADIEINGSVLQTGAGFHFSCSRDRGAALIINSEGFRRDSEQRGAFKKYMLKHHNSWMSFANNPPNSRDVFLHDLVFVTGRDNTADWAVAAFTEKSTSGGISFQSGFTPLVNASFSIWGSWTGTRNMYSNCGPQLQPTIAGSGDLLLTSTTNSIPGLVCAADLNLHDQCIFMRGFRFMDRKSQVYGMVKLKVPGSSDGFDMITRPLFRSNTKSSTSSLGAFKSSNDNKARGSGNTRSTMSPISPVSPETSQPALFYTAEPEDFSPPDYLLAYILHNTDAKLAMIHDDDVSAVVKSCNEYTTFLEALLQVKPQVVVDSAGGVRFLLLDLKTCDLSLDVHSKVGSITVSEESLKVSSLPVLSNVQLDPEGLKTDIDALQTQLSEIKRKISLFSKTGPAADHQALLGAEIEALRGAIEKNKLIEKDTATQVVKLQEKMYQKSKSLDESGKKLIPTQTLMELKKTPDTTSKNLSERLQALSGELAILRKEKTAAHANRGQLFQERDDVQRQLKELQEKRRIALERVKLKEEEKNEEKRTEQAFKAERTRKERQAKEQQQRLEARARLLERARAPAFLGERQDLNVLLAYFSPMVAGAIDDLTSPTTPTFTATPNVTRRNSNASGSLLDSNHPGPGWIPLQAKKKIDEDFFIGKANKKKNLKTGHRSNSGSRKMNIPMPIIELLSSHDVTPPMTFNNIPDVINDIQRKLQWLDDHEADATASNLAMVEASLQPLHLLAQ